MGMSQSKPDDAETKTALSGVMGTLYSILERLDKHIPSENGDSSTVTYRTVGINIVKSDIKVVIQRIESVIQGGNVKELHSVHCSRYKETDPHTVGILDPVSSAATENFIKSLYSWLPEDVELNCLDNTSKIDAHTFVICNNSSRLETDINATLKGLQSKDWNKIMVIVLHVKSKDQLPVRKIEKVLQGNDDYKEIKYIVDMAYTKADKIYTCDMNAEAHSKIGKFLLEPMKSTNEESSKVNTKEDDNEMGQKLPVYHNDKSSKVNTKEDDNERGKQLPGGYNDESSEVNTKEDDNEGGQQLSPDNNNVSSKVNTKEDANERGQTLAAGHNDESSNVNTKEDANERDQTLAAGHNDVSSNVSTKEDANERAQTLAAGHNDESSNVNTKEDANERGQTLTASQNDESSKINTKEDDSKRDQNKPPDNSDESSKVNAEKDDNERGQTLAAGHNDESSDDNSKEERRTAMKGARNQ